MLIPVFAALGLLAVRGWRGELALLWGLGGFLVVVGLLAPAGLAAWGMPTVDAYLQTSWWWLFLQVCSLPVLVSLGSFAVTARRVSRSPSTRLIP
jgi:hypothetical protein